MQFTMEEQKMIAALQRQRQAWPKGRYFLAVLSAVTLAISAWEFGAEGWGPIPLIYLVVGAACGSTTYRNWNGRPEAWLLLRLIEQQSLAGSAPVKDNSASA